MALQELLSGMALGSQEYEIAAFEEEEPAQYQFVTAADEKVCEECGPLDGAIFDELEVDDLFDWEELTPEVLQANLHINCRCELLRITSPESEDVFSELL